MSRALRRTPALRGLSRFLGRAAFRATVAAVLFYLLFPFLWAISSSLKTSDELYGAGAALLPRSFVWQNYAALFEDSSFVRALLNSAVVAGGTTLLALVVGCLAAYALGRHPFRGRMVVFFAILGVSMFPQISILGGVYMLINEYGLYNSWWGLIISYMVFTLPFTVWVLTAFVRDLPRELEEAAMVDGANPLQTLWHVLLPMMAPGLVTAGLLAFIQAWNEFLFALTFTSDDSARTVPVAIALFSGGSQYELPWPKMMAASVVVTVPLIVLVLLFQRRIVSGLTAGAVKG